VSEHSELLSEVVNLSGNISSSIDDIRDKSNSQYTEKLTAFVQRIVDWMKRMQDSGNQIPASLGDIQNLSKRLEERSRNMNDLLQGQREPV
jgi:methyl-accepting chemotaxis protein